MLWHLKDSLLYFNVSFHGQIPLPQMQEREITWAICIYGIHCITWGIFQSLINKQQLSTTVYANMLE